MAVEQSRMISWHGVTERTASEPGGGFKAVAAFAHALAGARNLRVPANTAGGNSGFETTSGVLEVVGTTLDERDTQPVHRARCLNSGPTVCSLTWSTGQE